MIRIGHRLRRLPCAPLDKTALAFLIAELAGFRVDHGGFQILFVAGRASSALWMEDATPEFIERHLHGRQISSKNRSTYMVAITPI